LGYKDIKGALQNHVPNKYKTQLKDIINLMAGADVTPTNIQYNEGKAVYINEAGLYELIFNSKMKKAREFKDWVFEEVLPKIRKHGYYVAPNADADKIRELEEELKEQRELNDRLHNIQRELLTYKKRVEKNEIVYIVSTANYARQGIFKVGRTKTQMKFRSSSHNTTHIQGDKVKVLKEFKVNDSAAVERNIHTKLSGLLLDGEKEFFMCPFDLLESLAGLIVHNDDEENQAVNRIIDTVYNLKKRAFDSIDWTSGIPEDTFKETITLADDAKKLAEFDVSAWSKADKQEFVANCLRAYVEQNKKVNLVWKEFQKYLISQLSIPKTKFKVGDWKPHVKEEEKNESIKGLTIKWKTNAQ
jgi:prophage antirepressor-like protein